MKTKTTQIEFILKKKKKQKQNKIQTFSDAEYFQIFNMRNLNS